MKNILNPKRGNKANGNNRGEPSARETDAVPAPLRSIEKDEEQPVI